MFIVALITKPPYIKSTIMSKAHYISIRNYLDTFFLGKTRVFFRALNFDRGGKVCLQLHL